MKKFFIVFISIFVLSACIFAVDSVTAAVKDAQPAETAKEKSIFETIGNLFAPSKQNTAEAVSVTAEESLPAQEEEAGFTFPAKLLIAGDLFSTAFCVITITNLAQKSSYYETVYADINNTTLENYDTLVTLKRNLESTEGTAWIAAGVCAAFIGYTIADAVWLHVAFPVAANVVFKEDARILTFNYGF